MALNNETTPPSIHDPVYQDLSSVSLSINPMTRLAQSELSRSIVNNASHPQYLSRYHGGHRRDNHPYVSGYWYFIINPPERLFGTGASGNSANILGSQTIEKARDWMHCTAESFTPPSRTLTKMEVVGMGGMKSNYPVGQEITRTFSVTFREYQELPIFNILQTWTSAMDPNTGTSTLAGAEFIPANYKGSAFVALCKPTIGNRAGTYTQGAGTDPTSLRSEDIEQLFYFDGVFPESAPYDSLTSDISTNEGLSIPVSFSFDGFPLLKDSYNVMDQFLKLVQNLKIGSTYEHYIQSIDNATTKDSRNNVGGKLLGTNENSAGSGLGTTDNGGSSASTNGATFGQ